MNPSPFADIVLIYPYFYTHAPRAMLFHPLGVAQLSALLRQEGLRVVVVDGTFLDKEAALARIVAAAPKIAGIYSMLSMTDNAFWLAAEIRKHLPQTLIACGGPMPTLKPRDYRPAFHLVFRGEAAASFPMFCAAYIRENAAIADISAIAAKTRPAGLHDLTAPDAVRLDIPPRHLDEAAINALPIPDRSDFDHPRYQQFWRDRGDFAPATVMTSYGCPFDCDFCSKPIFGKWFRRRDMDGLFSEITDIKAHGYDGLWIGDDCFTLDMDHVRSFCRRMTAEHLDMKWTCLSRVDAVTEADVRLMKQAGCRKVFFGLESGSDVVLRKMNKHATVADAERTLRLFADARVRTAGFFMVGYPGETRETIEQTFHWALSLPLDEISFTVPYPLPGTRLYEQVRPADEATDWQYENEIKLMFPSDVDEAFLKRRIAEVHEAFDRRRAASRAGGGNGP